MITLTMRCDRCGKELAYRLPQTNIAEFWDAANRALCLSLMQDCGESSTKPLRVYCSVECWTADLESGYEGESLAMPRTLEVVETGTEP